jgi:hypothetical protein
MQQASITAYYATQLQQIGVPSGQYEGKRFNLKMTMERFEINFADLCSLVQKCRIRVYYDYPRDEICFDALEFAYFHLTSVEAKTKCS